MTSSNFDRPIVGLPREALGDFVGIGGTSFRHFGRALSLSSLLDDLTERIAPCVWQAHVGLHPDSGVSQAPIARAPLYTADERRRRDATPWTRVQAVLAPLQFVAFAVSLVLVVRFMLTGQGYFAATASILIKTLFLYAIMATGSIWEKVVFNKWLFAPSFFWEDVFSILVLGLQTAYLLALVFGWGDARQQMLVAMAAYACYVINATQFLLKLRAARLEGPGANGWAPTGTGRLA